MSAFSTAAAKKAFHPPFKVTAVHKPTEHVQKATQLRERVTCVRGFSRGAAYYPSPCANAFPGCAAPSGRGDAEASFYIDSYTTEAASTAEPLIGDAGHTADQDRTNCSQRRKSEVKQRSDAPHRDSSDSGEANSLVKGTLYWIVAAQKAAQFLADTTTNGDVERVLAGLHIDPLTVLYSTEECDFVQP